MNDSIQILEEYKNNYLNIHEADKEGIELGHAIENLIKGYRELEEKYNNLKIRHNGTKEALRVSEDLERHFSEEASKLEAELDNSIPKSKIKEKIEELNNNRNYLSTFKDWEEKDYTNEDIINNCVEVLQELLGDE